MGDLVVLKYVFVAGNGCEFFTKTSIGIFERNVRIGRNEVRSAVCVNAVLAVSMHTSIDNKCGAIFAKASYGSCFQTKRFWSEHIKVLWGNMREYCVIANTSYGKYLQNMRDGWNVVQSTLLVYREDRGERVGDLFSKAGNVRDFYKILLMVYFCKK